MKLGLSGLVGLSALASLGASAPDADYPLNGTLPNEQDIIPFCGVSDTLDDEGR